MRDAYEARDADRDRWRDEMGRDVPQQPPVNGADRLRPPGPRLPTADRELAAPRPSSYQQPPGTGGFDSAPSAPRPASAPRLEWAAHAPPPPPSLPDAPEAVTRHEADEASSDAKTGAGAAPRARSTGRQLRAVLDRITTTARRSVPLRTVLFVLPPLVLPWPAFDLSVGAALVVALLLLWLAAATAVLCMIMLEGSRHVALRALGDRLQQLSGPGALGGTNGTSGTNGSIGSNDTAVAEALVALSQQLDRLDAQVVALVAGIGQPADGAVSVPSHRPHDPGHRSQRGEQDDRYGRPAAPDPDWGESRWRR